jgi:hypothetical protein
MPKWTSLALTGLLAVFVGVVNVTSSTRDGTYTTEMPSFKSSEIVANRLWTEAPMQVLHTFMGAQGSILFAGEQASGGLPFVDRLRSKLGDNRVDSSSPPLDLREVLGAEDLAFLERFVQTFSYRSSMPCPHDPNAECIIAVGWNRERTKEAGMRWLVTRISEDTYLILDDSIVSLE